MPWYPYDGGRSLGQRGTEAGLIVQDHELDGFARITLEENGEVAPFTITWGIYGWAFGTCFFGSRAEALDQYRRMQVDLAPILDLIPLSSDPDWEQKSHPVIAAIHDFNRRYS